MTDQRLDALDGGSGLGTILGVWAHPDDETYLSAAHMMRATQAGDRVRCVTATRGELGSPDPERWPPGEVLARVRTEELDAALAALGVTDHHWLDYPDGGCPDVPLDEGAARVLEHLEEVRPDTVLTFGPDGITGHTDHTTVSRWVDAAVERWSGPRPQVLWATNTPGWLGRWQPRLAAAGAYMTTEPPPPTPLERLRSYLLLGEAERDAKMQALLCQVSQIQPMVDAFGLDEFRDAMSEEAFR